MNTNMKILSSACALTLGLVMAAAAPSAFAQVSFAQSNAALGHSGPDSAAVYAAPALAPEVADIVARTNFAELRGLSDGAIVQQGVVQAPFTASHDAPVAAPAPRVNAALAGLADQTNSAELNGLPDGSSFEQGIVD